MLVYLDSSALAKRYIQEKGTGKILEICGEADDIILSQISILELISAFNRLLREGSIRKEEYAALKSNMLDDVEQATLYDLSPQILQDTIGCLERVSLRALDGIHVATARQTHCDLFVSADHKQCLSAKELGLEVLEVK